MVLKQFFISSWIMPNYNANTLILIPKVPNANSIEIFRTITLYKFKFKIIFKVSADSLSPIMP